MSARNILMCEKYSGCVKEIYADGSVRVIYEVDGDLVTQIYEKKQFIHRPKKGDDVVVLTTVIREPKPKKQSRRRPVARQLLSGQIEI